MAKLWQTEYQNIFTQVQVQGPPEMGMVEDADLNERGKGAGFSQLVGWVGNAQLGPFYLGGWGLLSLIAGATWFVMVSFWFWAHSRFIPAVF